MAVNDPDTVDFISIDETTGRVVLTISDHLEWERVDEHVALLERKVEAYVRFARTDQLLEIYPEAENRQVEIEAVFKHSPTPMGLKKLEKIQAAVEQAGLVFSHEVLSLGSP